MRWLGIIRFLTVSLAWLGLTPLPQLQSQGSSTPVPYQPPVVDLTTSLGKLLPDGTQQAQTYYPAVGPGRASTTRIPACLGSGEKSAGANCIKLCVRMPLGSKLTRVESFAQEVGPPPWLACDSKQCLGRPVDQVKAMFDASGYVADQTPDSDRVCWVFRNWHPSKERIAVLLVMFRAPTQ